MSFIVIIPARYQSTRLPTKLLCDIGGKSMIERTYIQACASQAQSVIIATDNSKIVNIAQSFNAKVCLTDVTCQSGTQRIAQVVKQQAIADDTIIVNVQGDEPMLPSELINQVAQNLANSQANIATLCEPITSLDQYQDENCVKVVCDKDDYALYFSRSPIPYFRHQATFDATICYRHIGLYAYRAKFLRALLDKESSAYEQAEKLEQLSFLYHGHRIKVTKAVKSAGYGVDIQADLDKVREFY